MLDIFIFFILHIDQFRSCVGFVIVIYYFIIFQISEIYTVIVEPEL
jgi:hypothetical protein